MNTLDTLAVKLAERVAPDEVDFAPAIMQAFVQGGKARASLFEKSRTGTVGAFGAGMDFLTLPAVIATVVEAAPILESLLRTVSAALDVVTKRLALKCQRMASQEQEERKKEMETLDEPYRSPIEETAKSLSESMEKHGVSPDQSGARSMQIICVFLDNRESFENFLDTIRKIQ